MTLDVFCMLTSFRVYLEQREVVGVAEIDDNYCNYDGEYSLSEFIFLDAIVIANDSHNPSKILAHQLSDQLLMCV